MTTAKIIERFRILGFWETFFGGHINIGNVTIFGENAMHWAIQISTKKYGYIVITLPIKCFGRYWGSHIYFSPNGTPWASTFYKSLFYENNIGEEIRARIRKLHFGHNFSTNRNWSILQTINAKFEWIKVCGYDLERFAPNKEKGDYIPDGDCVKQIV